MTQSNQTLAYLMTDSGALVQLKSSTILQNFKSYNVLIFYTTSSHSLYNWIGKKANKVLIEHIENAEQLLLKMHPGMTVLRHISVNEKEKEVLSAFLEDIGISQDDYKERMQLWHEFEISIYSDIQKLKIAENNHLMLNKLDKAMDVSSKIIELAKQIHDFDLVKEKSQLIEDTKKKLEIKTTKTEKLTEINRLIPKLKQCIDVQNVEEAVPLYNQIILYYKSINESPTKEHQEVIQTYEDFYSKWEQDLLN